MIFWILMALITAYVCYWFFTKPHLLYDYDESPSRHKPIGLRFWMIPVIFIVSIAPVLNIIVLLALIILLFVWKSEEDLTWDKVFPNSGGKFFKFWNKQL